MELVHCIYCSASTSGDLSDADLLAVLDQSRRNNAKLEVTGILLYQDGSFFQVLEGDRAVVEPLFDKIATDRRHDRVTKIILEPIEQRAFGDWTMGYPHVTRKELAEIPGLNDFFTHNETFVDIGEGRARALLAAFKDGKWRSSIS